MFRAPPILAEALRSKMERNNSNPTGQVNPTNRRDPLNRRTSLLICAAIVTWAIPGMAQEKKNPVVLMTTSMGDIKIELYPEQAPITVENFLKYVESGFFEGTIFHRVVPGFVIQGGGFNKDMERKETLAPIKNEAKTALAKGLKNTKYTLSMARTNNPNSATSQFFVNLADNTGSLDPNARSAGYAVFGKVIDGEEAVEKIHKVKTKSFSFYQDMPVDPVLIEKVVLVGKKKEDAQPAAADK